MLSAFMGIVGIGILFAIAIGITCSRGVRLRQMASTLGWQYARKTVQLVTEENFTQLAFFRYARCAFRHIVTVRENGAFLRIYQAQIAHATNSQTYTLVSVELTQGSLPRMILSYHQTKPSSSGNLPADLGKHYSLQAEPGYRLPNTVANFLKTAHACYIETIPTALVYHEYGTVSVKQLQALRFRVMQLVKELKQETEVSLPEQMPHVVSTAQVTPTSLTSVELQAEMLLKMHTSSRLTSPDASGKWIYALVLLMMLAGMCILAWFLLRQVVPH